MGERFLDTEEVGSSILPVPTIIRLTIEMDSIHVTLPDGKSVEVQRGTRIDEIGSLLSVTATIIAAKIDGRPVDLSRRLDERLLLGMGVNRQP